MTAPVAPYLSDLLNVMQQAMITTDAAGIVTSWNRAAEQLVGWSVEEALGQPVETLLQFVSRSERRDGPLAPPANRASWSGDGEIIRKDGHRQPVSITQTPLTSDDGVTGALIEVVKREQAPGSADSEALHRLILSSISDAVFITDEAGEFTYVCPNVDVIWGYDDTTVEQMGNISRLLGSTLCDTPLLDQVGELTNIECEISNRAGEQRTLLANIKRVDIGAGTRLYTCRDATERKHMTHALVAQKVELEQQLAERLRVEDALRTNQSLLWTVVDTLPVGVWVLDADGKLVLSTPAGSEIWGGQRDFGAYHYVAWNFVTGERIEGDKWALWRALRLGESTLNEMLDIETFDGQRRTVLNSAVPIRDADGLIVGAIAVNQDVTEQRRAQQAEQEERRFATALSNTISRLSSSLNLQDVLEAVLENIGQVVPHDAANISLIEGDIARPVCWRGYSAEANAYFEALRYPLTTPWIERMLKTGEADLVNDVTHKPGWPATPSLAWLGSVLSVPVRAHETIIGFLNLDSATPGFFSDLHRERLRVFADQAAIAVENARLYTRVRNHAAELEQRVRERTVALEDALAKEKELSELKSRFVSMVSHEFRTPLASIQTSTDLLHHYYERMTRERRGEALLRIQHEIKRLTMILENVLTFGRVEAVGVAITPRKVDLVGLCRGVVAEVERDLRTPHDIAFHTNLGHALVLLDEKVMRHALFNLLENAVKYSPAGSRVTMDLTVEDGHARVAVSDRGIGIPQQDMAHLFEAFHRGTNVGNAQGTGLGLVIVKHAVEAHNGSVDVQSVLGEGTTFTVTLPRAAVVVARDV